MYYNTTDEMHCTLHYDSDEHRLLSVMHYNTKLASVYRICANSQTDMDLEVEKCKQSQEVYILCSSKHHFTTRWAIFFSNCMCQTGRLGMQLYQTVYLGVTVSVSLYLCCQSPDRSTTGGLSASQPWLRLAAEVVRHDATCLICCSRRCKPA